MSNLRFKPGWEFFRESEATPESIYIDRRSILKSLGYLAISGGSSALSLMAQSPEQNGVPQGWSTALKQYFPAPQNRSFQVTGGITDESIVTGYNNFYEFSRNKTEVPNLVESFRCHPWEVELKGEVSKRITIDLDDLIRIGDLEERSDARGTATLTSPKSGGPCRRRPSRIVSRMCS